MTNTETNQTLDGSPTRPEWRDFYEMCKPRVVLLMLLCSVVGMFLATPGMVPLDILILGNLGIALVSGSAAAMNHLVDSKIDADMARTKARPMAQGRVSNRQGAIFVGITGILGVTILVVFINPLTAWLTLASWIGYGVIYSLYLKRASPQNIVIGGIFGAAPPLFGWTAVTNSLDGGGLILVLIIFAWTPPHFWALAIERKNEYAKVDVPMLPVTHGVAYTKLHILLYTIIMILTTLLPYIIGMSNLFYLVCALLLGGRFLYWSLVLLKGDNRDAPMKTFRYSIVYLMLLFAALLIDHYLLPVNYIV